jgi:CubicO group peptidase (beta-lactamase class C family)
VAPILELASQVGATAVVVLDRDRELLSVGDPSAAVDCRSIRKPLLGAMFGRHVLAGTIDLDATLAELGIDDSVPPSLTSAERSARVRDLLTCRSGVYHPSNQQGPEARAALPARGAHRPGTQFLYNNWDFNALGTILERHIGRSLFDEFAATIAGPAALPDFDLSQQQYLTEPWSEHRTYSFRISTRDLARFGQLYLRGGHLDLGSGQLDLRSGRPADGTVIAPEWVAASTRAHTRTGVGPAYGYLWWIADRGRLFAGLDMPTGSFAAYGSGSQFLLVIPALDRVIALLADPSRPGAADRTALLPRLAELVYHATDGEIPLAPGRNLTCGPY